jgi:carboxyl-terminal processing protease
MDIKENNSKPATKREIWLPLFLSLAMIGGIFVGLKLQNEPLISKSQKRKLSTAEAEQIVGQGRMEEILRYVDAKYVDRVNDELMVDKAINNLLEELDPHSVYIPADDLAHITEELEGEYEGIGLEALLLDDTLTIITPIANSPAERSGLMSGDKILFISDSSAIGKDLRWLNAKLRGKRGTQLQMTILRGGDFRPRQISLERDRISTSSIDGTVVLDDNIGFIKISRFSAHTSREFMQALELLFEKKGVKNLIIDLRGNPGGYLDKAVDVLSQIFPDKDQLLVTTKGRTVHKNEYKTSGRQRYKVGKLAVLIDEGAASASEIVAGAVQDWDRGIIIGRRSFGKGLVQEPYELRDGSELRLTVARYYTPIGRSIQRPYIGKTKSEYNREGEKQDLVERDTEGGGKTQKYRTPGGRIVLGGGGINPDIYVPVEIFSKNASYQNLKIWVDDYAFKYFNIHRKELTPFKTAHADNDWQNFNRNFKVTDYSFNEFIRYTERQNVPRSNTDMPIIKEPIKRLIKARIARQLFGDEGYFGILSTSDACIQSALDALKKEDPLGLRKLAERK